MLTPVHQQHQSSQQSTTRVGALMAHHPAWVSHYTGGSRSIPKVHPLHPKTSWLWVAKKPKHKPQEQMSPNDTKVQTSPRECNWISEKKGFDAQLDSERVTLLTSGEDLVVDRLQTVSNMEEQNFNVRSEKGHSLSVDGKKWRLSLCRNSCTQETIAELVCCCHFRQHPIWNLFLTRRKAKREDLLLMRLSK